MNDELRAACLALRDLREMVDVLGARLLFDDGTEIHADELEITLVQPGESKGLNITPLVEWTGAMPV